MGFVFDVFFFFGVSVLCLKIFMISLFGYDNGRSCLAANSQLQGYLFFLEETKSSIPQDRTMTIGRLQCIVWLTFDLPSDIYRNHLHKTHHGSANEAICLNNNLFFRFLILSVRALYVYRLCAALFYWIKFKMKYVAFLCGKVWLTTIWRIGLLWMFS